MTGDELIVRLRVGDYLRLAHRNGKVHRAYIDERTGDLRICRPSMLQKTDAAGPKEWVQAEVGECGKEPCRECK